jgi:hypothetical protein
LLEAVKCSDPFSFAIDAIISAPLALIFSKMNSLFSGRIVYLNWSVLAVLCMRRDTQIAQPVISSIAVDMINIIGGVASVYDGPNNSVGLKTSTVKSDKPIAASLRKLGKITDLPAGSCRLASQSAGLFVVRKELSKIVNWERFWSCWHSKSIYEMALFRNMEVASCI